jgi:purine nucleosidase
MAILLASGCPDIELQAITTVAGNQTLEKTTLNARKVCTVAGISDVPIFAGCDRPLIRAPITAAHIHGQSGLDGWVTGAPTVPVQAEHAVDYLVRALMGTDGEVTLVPTGPLTNVGMAVRREPGIVRRVREVVLMGGSYTRGNHTPAAEFNILADPEAAAIVFGAGWPITMVGLDVTRQAGIPDGVMDDIRAFGSPLGGAVVGWLEFFRGAGRGRSPASSGPWAAGPPLGGRPPGPPLHDPCAVAYVARPSLFTTENAFVAVETRGEWTVGMTVTDFLGKLGQPPNAKVATGIDVDGFWKLMAASLAAASGRALSDHPGFEQVELDVAGYVGDGGLADSGDLA